jgi:hypothetical protein
VVEFKIFGKKIKLKIVEVFIIFLFSLLNLLIKKKNNYNTMYVVVEKQNETNNINIIKILKVDDKTSVQLWMNTYMLTQLESMRYAPNHENIKYVTYMIRSRENSDSLELIKQFKKVNKGYIYNSSEWLEEVIMSIDCIKCEDNILYESSEIPKSQLWHDTNTEINIRVLQQLDYDSSINVISHFIKSSKSKSSSFQEEMTVLLSDSLKFVNRDLYNNVMRKVKKLRKRNGILFIDTKKKEE